jgi:hypothetical protein
MTAENILTLIGKRTIQKQRGCESLNFYFARNQSKKKEFLLKKKYLSDFVQR